MFHGSIFHHWHHAEKTLASAEGADAFHGPHAFGPLHDDELKLYGLHLAPPHCVSLMHGLAQNLLASPSVTQQRLFAHVVSPLQPL